MIHIHTIADVEKLLQPYEAVKHAGAYKLDTIRQLMKYLGDPQERIRVIHVAGTSGKTSTSYYIASLLTAAGYNVGLSVSPHINTVQERTQVNVDLIQEAEYCALLEEFMALIEGSNLEPSYFELIVAFSYWVFARKELDFAVIEVGLGGLLDGTNIVNRPDKICVITDIGLDHQEILGDTLGEIATQKAGIIHQGNEVYLYEQGDEVMESIRQVASNNGGFVHIVDKKATVSLGSLSGFQRRNFGLALAVVQAVLGKLPDDVAAKAAQTVVPARMELLQSQTGIPVVVDGSHNQQKIRALIDSFKEAFPGARPILIVGFGGNRSKAMSEGLALLREISDSLIATSFGSHQDVRQQSLGTAVIAQEAKQQGFERVYEEPVPTQALDKALGLQPEMVLLTGSLYLPQYVLPSLRKR